MKKRKIKIIKYAQVTITGLPKQDYAKAKKLYEILNVGEHCNIRVIDLEEFKYFCTLFANKPVSLIVKPTTNGFVTVCKHGVE
jgi:hypothetical protein